MSKPKENAGENNAVPTGLPITQNQLFYKMLLAAQKRNPSSTPVTSASKKAASPHTAHTGISLKGSVATFAIDQVLLEFYFNNLLGSLKALIELNGTFLWIDKKLSFLHHLNICHLYPNLAIYL